MGMGINDFHIGFVSSAYHRHARAMKIVIGLGLGSPFGLEAGGSG
jgi:hypothetical protein